MYIGKNYVFIEDIVKSKHIIGVVNIIYQASKQTSVKVICLGLLTTQANILSFSKKFCLNVLYNKFL